jgi:hypothetical protein
VLKPAEEYPKKQIERINGIMQEIARRSAASAALKESTTQTGTVQQQTERMITDETEALYASLLTTADQAFTGKEYNVSRAWYYKALELKPAEPYPADQISKIATILANMQLSQAEREFQQFIDKGDEAFRSGEPAVARSWYNHALGIRDDQYARSQLTEIQIKINERLQGGTNKTYEAYLEQGDKAFGQKQYSVARVWYQRALQIRHGDETSLQKLEAVKNALAGKTE